MANMCAQGQLLFTIDPRPFAAALAEARAAGRGCADCGIRSRDAELGRALTLVPDRSRCRAKRSTTSGRRRDPHMRNIAATDAVVGAATRSTLSSRRSARRSAARFPIAASIRAARLQAAREVPGTLLTTINALDPIYFTFDVSEGLFLKAQREREPRRSATPVEIRLQDEADYRWHGRLDFTDNGLDARSGTIRARAVVAQCRRIPDARHVRQHAPRRPADQSRPCSSRIPRCRPTRPQDRC